MNRRAFVRGAGAALGASLVPTWVAKRPHKSINLLAFCGEDNMRFRMSSPFVQATHGAAYKYATDARICVRVPTWEDDRGEESKMPPVETLEWGIGDAGKWMPWPKPHYLDCFDVPCPVCDGTGHSPSLPCPHCEHGGCSQCGWSEDEDNIVCCLCRGTGDIGPACQECGGRAVGTFPAALMLRDGLLVDRKFDALMRRELGDGIEWSGAWDVTINSSSRPNANGLAARFRFPGGDGLLMACNFSLAASDRSAT